MAVNQDDRKPLKTLDAVMTAVEQWREKAFVVGVATLGEIPTGHKVNINVVTVDPDEPGCVFPTGGSEQIEINGKKEWHKLLGLGAVVLQRIAQAAGLDWIPELSGRVDDGRDPDRIVWQAAASYMDLSGATHSVTGTYEMNFGDREAELLQSKGATYDKKASSTYEDKRNKGKTEGDVFRAENPDRQKWIDESVRADMLRMRITGIQRAETGAKSRVIASALGVRRGGYLAIELRRKPFAVFRLVDDIDWQNDPQAHAAQIMRASGLAKALAFGGARQSLIHSLLPQPAAPALPAIAAPANSRVEDPDAPLVLDAEPVASVPADAEPVQDTKPADTDAETLPTVEQFVKLGRQERENLLLHLAATRVREPMPDFQVKPLAERGNDWVNQWYAALVASPLRDAVAEEGMP